MKNCLIVKLCLSLAVFLWKCQFIITIRPIIGDDINVCEHVADHLFIQDIRDCTKYFVCVNGQAKSQQCRSGLYFDAIRQACTANRQGCLQCPSGRMINFPLTKTCDKYISCYYGQSLLKKCASNQQFNIKAGKCDLAKNVDCVDNHCSIHVTQKNLMYVPSAASCEKYYVCQEGKAKLMTCPDGLYFNAECNCCDSSENVNCLAKSFETPTANDKQKRYNEDDMELKYTSTLIEETNKVKCPAKGYFLYQYIEDSEHYITCINGRASLYACANGFHFDDKLKRCVNKENEKQLNSNISEVNSTETSNCPKFGVQLIAHVKNTNKYILCINGKAMEFDCPADHYFDVTDNICRTYFVGQRKKREFENKYVLSFAQASNTDDKSENEANIKCPVRGKTTLPHVKRNQYYLCIEGTAALFTCAPGLFYNPILKSCAEPASSESNIEIYSSTLDSEAGSIICPKFGSFKFPHVDKSKFFICIDGNTYTLTCADNEIFDADGNICRQNIGTTLESEENNNFIAQSLTELTSPVICPSVGRFMFSHVEKSHYYVCIDGDAIVFACADDHYFDATTNSCQHDWSSTESKKNQTPVVLNEPVYILCPSFGVIRFAHNEKNKFYLCVNGMGSVLACSEGSFFEPEAEVCRRTFDVKKVIN